MKNEINGFYKVVTTHGSYEVATFYNPETQEEFRKTIYDYEDERVSIEAGDYYDLPLLDKTDEIVKSWQHKHGEILIGDKIVISRGRKMKGELKMVIAEYNYRIPNTYNKAPVVYLAFSDGTKCIKANCDLKLD